MKQIKILLFILLFLLASQDWGADIHDAALKGGRSIISPSGVCGAFGKVPAIFSVKTSNRGRAHASKEVADHQQRRLD
jgi:hypothetical protein